MIKLIILILIILLSGCNNQEEYDPVIVLGSLIIIGTSFVYLLLKNKT